MTVSATRGCGSSRPSTRVRSRLTQLALFPADRATPDHARGYGVQVRLDRTQLHRPGQWGACWLACSLYEQLGLDEFWSRRLPDSREGTRWRDILQTLVCYRLIDPGSEWRLHRLWFEQSAMGDLLGAARAKAPSAWRLVDIAIDPKEAAFSYQLNRGKLRQVRRREGRYLLCTNLSGKDPVQLWRFYIQLVEIEAAFKALKDDLGLRPIYHQLEQRIEAHIFIAFLAYCLHVTLRARLRPLAAGLTPRAALDKLAAIQMLDVHFPTTDGRTLILNRYTEPNADERVLLDQLSLTLPPSLRRASPQPATSPGPASGCSGDLSTRSPVFRGLTPPHRPQLRKSG